MCTSAAMKAVEVSVLKPIPDERPLFAMLAGGVHVMYNVAWSGMGAITQL